MGAYNYIEAECTCPYCGPDAPWRIQIHAASSFGGPEPQNRCCHRTYRLGELMYWWPANSTHYSKWREDYTLNDQARRAAEDAEDVMTELASSECLRCERKDLFAIVRFEKLRPVSILEVMREQDYDPETSEHTF